MWAGAARGEVGPGKARRLQARLHPGRIGTKPPWTARVSTAHGGATVGRRRSKADTHLSKTKRMTTRARARGRAASMSRGWA